MVFCCDLLVLASYVIYTSLLRIKNASIPVRFCTNESQITQSKIVERLQSLGFPVESHEVFSPIQAAKQFLKERNLRPYTIIHDHAIEAFTDIDQHEPNCVLLGDATNNFTYQALNEAFHVLLKSPILLTMGYGLV